MYGAFSELQWKSSLANHESFALDEFHYFYDHVCPAIGCVSLDHVQDKRVFIAGEGVSTLLLSTIYSKQFVLWRENTACSLSLFLSLSLSLSLLSIRTCRFFRDQRNRYHGAYECLARDLNCEHEKGRYDFISKHQPVSLWNRRPTIFWCLCI